MFPPESKVGVDVSQIGILVRADDGTATNRFGDGVAGVGKELAEIAEEVEEATCPECGAACTWERRP